MGGRIDVVPVKVVVVEVCGAELQRSTGDLCCEVGRLSRPPLWPSMVVAGGRSVCLLHCLLQRSGQELVLSLRTPSNLDWDVGVPRGMKLHALTEVQLVGAMIVAMGGQGPFRIVKRADLYKRGRLAIADIEEVTRANVEWLMDITNEVDDVPQGLKLSYVGHWLRAFEDGDKALEHTDDIIGPRKEVHRIIRTRGVLAASREIHIVLRVVAGMRRDEVIAFLALHVGPGVQQLACCGLFEILDVVGPCRHVGERIVWQ
jgi:hypothetical protein